MASCCSDDSTKAPENFHISDDEVGVLITERKTIGITGKDVDIIGTLKCPLCRTRQKRFNCKNCIKNGTITHSTNKNGESLNEKQQKYLSIQAGLKAFSSRYDRFIKEHKSKENVQLQIKRKKEELTFLRQVITKKRYKLTELREKQEDLCKVNFDKNKNLPRYAIKVKELDNYVLDRFEKISKLRERRSKLFEKLQEATRRGITQLVSYIFPIQEIVLRDELKQRVQAAIANNVQNEESETIAALADAKNTSYIRGKWVFHGSGISEMQYRIVAPSLPANGDYTAYLDWLTDNKDDVPKSSANEISPSRVGAYRIMGALTYTTQLTQLMSYYLNIRLPYKLAYGDFCKKLNEEQFLRRVTKLNSNIMYLAYTQQVMLRALNENHTLENILAILDAEKSNLGSYGYHEISNAPLMESVDSLLLGIETESESEDENSLRLDWEALPSLPPQPENSNLMPTGQQSTITEGLMTSAANRISSIFRWRK
ncbi:beclin 1-associated autophagy-related key regulator [Teleopsis dalmanni]|uniref:beclin 1-associated autophagy-related key regulator n=1 Tax=Teleopsis dalmanni TaxID=139649 RepID=UPI0018CCC36D|nr:beclin 1-associated autophagy-related key regulator [Teleopsis dalmanni]